MRLVKLFSFALLAVLVSLMSTGVTHAAITVDGPYIDTTTQGDWRGKFGSCFYLLPTPPPVIFKQFNIETTTPPPYCSGGSLPATWDIFTYQGQPIYAYYFAPNNIDTETRPAADGSHPADQWNPCANNGNGGFYGATFDNGDHINGIYEPLVSEVTVDFKGSLQIAYYFLEEYINHCREQKYKLFVNGVFQKEGIISNFDIGKYAVFNISGLSGTSTIRLEVINTLGTPCGTSEANYPNVHFSGVFINQCEENQGQGCTPGYWKQEQHFGSWCPDYTIDTMFNAVFGVGTDFKIECGKRYVSDPTLLDALNVGCGKTNALVRSAVAALLNACSSDVGYPVNEAWIIQHVTDAILSSGTLDDEQLYKKLDYWNNMGCPLGRNTDNYDPICKSGSR